ncbi:MAG: exopolyphosphatase [Alphaproteobacteria bacterium]|nr:exopolyphosphatase [Alphaproteobacteria bacterium]
MTTTPLKGLRAPRLRPVAIVDIGSNSVRMMIYDGLRRAPAPIFNEKILCGLGRGVAVTGRLADEAVDRALRALNRFRALCRQIGVKDIHAVATAATREAKNGAAFVARATDALGTKISVLSGRKEAQYAALGVLTGIPDADGVVGDLGGGSLELVAISDGEIGDGVTLPLGALRLIDLSSADMNKAKELAETAFNELDLLKGLKGKNFYAVGGTWRNLARIHMAHSHYPLNVLDHYEMGLRPAQSIAGLVAGLSPEALRGMDMVPKSRAETLPYGSMVLDRLLETSKPERVVISALGLREGLLLSRLKKKKRKDDPLLTACWDFARAMARSAEHEKELCAWTDQLFGENGQSEQPEQRRLRHAACLLADIGWRTHPNYRGEHSLTIVSQASFSGVNHASRVFLALVVFFRYVGVQGDEAPSDLVALLAEGAQDRARLLAAAQRLAYILSGAMPRLLPKIGLHYAEKKRLILMLPKRHQSLVGERVQKRLAELAGLTGHRPEIEIGG